MDALNHEDRALVRAERAAGAGDLDELDLAILRVLQRSGRATNQEVGEAVGLSPSAASRRIQALEQSGAILGYQALVDDAALGRSITVFIRVTLERQSAAALNAFEAAVRKMSGVWFCHLMAGQYDYILQMKVADIYDYDRLHRQELSALPGVARLESSFSVRDVVDFGRPRPTAKQRPVREHAGARTTR